MRVGVPFPIVVCIDIHNDAYHNAVGVPSPILVCIDLNNDVYTDAVGVPCASLRGGHGVQFDDSGPRSRVDANTRTQTGTYTLTHKNSHIPAHTRTHTYTQAKDDHADAPNFVLRRGLYELATAALAHSATGAPVEGGGGLGESHVTDNSRRSGFCWNFATLPSRWQVGGGSKLMSVYLFVAAPQTQHTMPHKTTPKPWNTRQHHKRFVPGSRATFSHRSA